MPLSIRRYPPSNKVSLQVKEAVHEAIKFVGRQEVFVLLLSVTLVIAHNLIANLILGFLILAYFVERWELVEWFKQKNGGPNHTEDGV